MDCWVLRVRRHAECSRIASFHCYCNGRSLADEIYGGDKKAGRLFESRLKGGDASQLGMFNEDI